MRKPNPSEEELLHQIVALQKKLGHPPSIREYKAHTGQHGQTLANKFDGSWKTVIERAQSFSVESEVSTEKPHAEDIPIESSLDLLLLLLDAREDQIAFVKRVIKFTEYGLDLKILNQIISKADARRQKSNKPGSTVNPPPEIKVPSQVQEAIQHIPPPPITAPKSAGGNPHLQRVHPPPVSQMEPKPAQSRPIESDFFDEDDVPPF